MRRWVFTDTTLGDSSRQVLVTLAPADPGEGHPERIDVATRGASWETWSPPLAVSYTDHDPGSPPSRYVGGDRTYNNEPGTLIALDNETVEVVIHALRQTYLFDGPTADADYARAAAVVVALGGKVDTD